LKHIGLYVISVPISLTRYAAPTITMYRDRRNWSTLGQLPPRAMTTLHHRLPPRHKATGAGDKSHHTSTGHQHHHSYLNCPTNPSIVTESSYRRLGMESILFSSSIRTAYQNSKLPCPKPILTHSSCVSNKRNRCVSFHYLKESLVVSFHPVTTPSNGVPRTSCTSAPPSPRQVCRDSVFLFKWYIVDIIMVHRMRLLNLEYILN